MDKSEAQTADSQQEIRLPPPPHRLRIVAWLIDYLIVILVFAFLPQPLYYLLFVVLLIIIYHTVLIWLVQQTIGKALLGLEVKRVGKKASLLWAFGRASLGYVAVDTLGVGILVALFNKRRRCLHDYVFGSVVVFQGADRMKATRLLSRLIEFAERHKSAVEEKKKTIAILILGGLWEFVLWLGCTLKKGIDFLIGQSTGSTTAETTPSVVEVLSSKAAAGITLVATATTTLILGTYAPSVRYAAEWWIAPRYFGAPIPEGGTNVHVLNSI